MPSINGPLYENLDNLGQYVESQVAQGSAVALTTNTTANVTSITLPAGDWNIFGVVSFIPAASTSITVLNGGSSQTSATLDVLGTSFGFTQAAVVPTAVAQTFPIPMDRVVLNQTTTIYLVARATFTVSTLGAFGVIGARRAALAV